MPLGCKALITALWIATSFGLSVLARASVLIPGGEPLHSLYAHRANAEALKLFGFLVAPMILLIGADVLWHKMVKR